MKNYSKKTNAKKLRFRTPSTFIVRRSECIKRSKQSNRLTGCY